MSPVTHRLAAREGKCLRCGRGPLVETDMPRASGGDRDREEREGDSAQ
jgi:hypothetical protein